MNGEIRFSDPEMPVEQTNWRKNEQFLFFLYFQLVRIRVRAMGNHQVCNVSHFTLPGRLLCIKPDNRAPHLCGGGCEALLWGRVPNVIPDRRGLFQCDDPTPATGPSLPLSSSGAGGRKQAWRSFRNRKPNDVAFQRPLSSSIRP